MKDKKPTPVEKDSPKPKPEEIKKPRTLDDVLRERREGK